MILVIAEKPSVAQSIAKVLGATSRKDGCMEGNNYIVSWCVGHLVGLADSCLFSCSMNCCSRAASLWYAISSSPILEDHFWLPTDPHFILSRLLSDITDSFSSYFQCHIAIIRNGHLHRFQILVHKLFLFRRTHFNSSRS